MGLRARDHVTSTLAELHWLPVGFRIYYSKFLSSGVSAWNTSVILSLLSTANLHGDVFVTDYLILRTKTKFGEQSFSVAGPTTWNALPESVRTHR